jgi:hypothetical protein
MAGKTGKHPTIRKRHPKQALYWDAEKREFQLLSTNRHASWVIRK